MAVNFMVDVETLGKFSNAVVLSIACVPFNLDDRKPFDFYLKEGFFVKLDSIQQAVDYKRSIDEDVLEWWKKQSPECRKYATARLSTDLDMVLAMRLFYEYLESKEYNFKKSYLWSRGCSFDFPILEHMSHQVRKRVPKLPSFNPWKIRDTRTYIDILAGLDNAMYDLKAPLPSSFIPHHCLHDAVKEVLVMTELYRGSINP